jgi:hypothetical protein
MEAGRVGGLERDMAQVDTAPPVGRRSAKSTAWPKTFLRRRKAGAFRRLPLVGGQLPWKSERKKDIVVDTGRPLMEAARVSKRCPSQLNLKMKSNRRDFSRTLAGISAALTASPSRGRAHRPFQGRVAGQDPPHARLPCRAKGPAGRTLMRRANTGRTQRSEYASHPFRLSENYFT